MSFEPASSATSTKTPSPASSSFSTHPVPFITPSSLSAIASHRASMDTNPVRSPLLSSRISTIRRSLPHPSSPSSVTLSSSAESSSSKSNSLPRATQPPLHGQNRRQIYLYHEQLVPILSGSDNAYALAALRANASSDAAEKAQHALDMMRRRESIMATRLRQLESRSVRAYLFPSRTSGEITQLRQSLASIAERSLAAKVHLRRLRRKATSDSSRAKRLRADANLLEASQSARRDIMEGSKRKLSDEEDSFDEDNYHYDPLAKVKLTAINSLAAQQEAYRLLRKAVQIISEVQRLISDAQISNSMDVRSSVIHQSFGVGKQYKLKMAGWKAREAGKQIERTAVLNDDLPIQPLVEHSKEGLLNVSTAQNMRLMSEQKVAQVIEEITRTVNEVSDQLRESVDVQENVVDRLKGHAVGSSTEIDRTSQELGPMRSELLRRFLTS